MQEKMSDLIYTTRNLCEYLRDRQDIDRDEELAEMIDDIEECLDSLAEEDD